MKETIVDFPAETAYEVLKELVKQFGADQVKIVVSQIELENLKQEIMDIHPCEDDEE